MARFAALVLATFACESGPTVEVFFPNQASLGATFRLRIEVHDPTSTGADRCSDFPAALAEDDRLLGSPSRVAEIMLPFDVVELEDVPSGRQLLFGTAYANDAVETPPFLAGCTDDYEAPLLLEHVPYPDLALREESGDRQVGRPGETLPQPLAVRGAIPDRDLSELDGCRRIELPFVPDAICLAQLDGDTRPDVVVSSRAERKLYVFPGDGNGGLLDPPQSLTVAAGPIACADFDGDGRDEVVVADEEMLGRFYVVRAR